MASSVKKKTVKRTAPAKRKPKRRAAASRASRGGAVAASAFGQYFLPGAISACILICLGVLVFFGYRTVTASNFFELREVQVAGTDRSSRQDIERIARGEAERSGVWNADLADIRQKVEKLPFVKTASVSRSLPNGLRVVVTERVPIALVRLSAGDYLIDNEAQILAPVDKSEQHELLLIRGWDESKSEKAAKDNAARIKMFQKMAADWGEFGLAKRVREVDLSDLLEPRAVIEDSGRAISVTLSRDEFAKSLKSAIEAVAGKGDRVRSVNSSGVYPVIEFIGSN
ncbi:MAG: cell division protein FtsQ/DivIB [Pyrinomonadaceae bacterium]